MSRSGWISGVRWRRRREGEIDAGEAPASQMPASMQEDCTTAVLRELCLGALRVREAGACRGTGSVVWEVKRKGSWQDRWLVEGRPSGGGGRTFAGGEQTPLTHGTWEEERGRLTSRRGCVAVAC